MKYYDALGLAPSLALDPDDLKKRFYDRSRQWHPDKFSRAAAADQQKALDMTAVLNDAFRTLRDPIARAEYFLEERGIPPSKSPPPELLEEVFEMNMALEELRSGDDSARPTLLEAEARFLKMRAEIDESLTVLFAQSNLPGIRQALDRRRYVSNLVRDVQKELAPKETDVHVPN